MTDEELIELVETKAPEELTLEEIERLGAALLHSAPLQQALATRLEMEQYLNAALGRTSLSADQIIARAVQLPQSPGRSAVSLLGWAVCLVLVGFMGFVLLVAMITPPPLSDTELKKIAAADERGGAAAEVQKPGEEPVPASADKPPAANPAPAAAPGAAKPAEPSPKGAAGPKPKQPDPAAAPVTYPWPKLADLESLPAPIGSEALEDFDTGVPTPQEADLRKWFAKVPGQVSNVGNSKVGATFCGVIDGVLRLQSPWAPLVALRVTVQETRRIQFHFWRENRGMTLQYYHNKGASRVWVAYETTRKPGAATPETVLLAGHDEGRNWRVNSSDPFTFDLRCDGKLLTLSRGDLRLLSVPFEGMPGEVFFEGQAALRQLQLVRAVDLPDEPVPGPVMLDLPEPAQQPWLTDLGGGGAAFDKLPDGRAELTGEKNKLTAWAALPLANDRVQEVVLQLDDPQSGTGVFLGDDKGKSTGGLGFYRDAKSGRMFVAQGNPAGKNGADPLVDRAEVPVAYCSGQPWIKILSGCGMMRFWISTDGAHWAQACEPWNNHSVVLGSVGLYCFPGTSKHGIKLRRVIVRELPAINALAPLDLRRRVPPFTAHFDMGSWLDAVFASQPADVDTAQWRTACAVRTLAANTSNGARMGLLDDLVEEVLASDRPWQERLKFLEEAARFCPSWDDPGMGQRFALHYSRFGNRLEQEGHPEALVRVAQAQLSAPLLSRPPFTLGLDAADREQILRLVYGQQWAELSGLCSQLRFAHSPPAAKKSLPLPTLIDWAEALASRQGPKHATLGAGMLRSDWRHPLVAELSKEAYNVLAELEGALDGKSYRDACQIISTAGNQAGPGVLPDSRDPALLTSLSGAVMLAMREHPALRTTMNEQFGPVGRLRIRQAIADGDAAAVEAGTVQFAGTEAAAEAHLWLADRDQAAGAFAQALAHYRETISFAPAGMRGRAVAGAQLAAAMMGQTFADEPVGTAEFGDVRVAPADFARLLSEMRSRRTANNTAGLAVIAGAHSVAPAATGYEVKTRGRLDGDVGTSPQSRPGDVQQSAIDWVARQCAAVVAGDRLILSNRFQVSCFNLQTNRFDWRAMLGGDQAGTHEWSLMPMRPLVTAGRIFVRRLPKRGPILACLETGSGKLLWTSKLEPEKFVVSDPLLIQDELFALTAMRAEQDLLLSLCTYDPESGLVLDERPLVRLREHWWQQRSCQVLALDDTFVVTCGGSTFRADLMGHIRWLRRETWVPPAFDRTWAAQEQEMPIEADRRLFLSQPGVRALECVDADTGRLVWQQPMPDLCCVVGVADGRVVVKTESGFAALEAASGNRLWQHPATALLDAHLCGGSRLLYARSVPLGDGKLFCPLLVWVDPATGHETACWPLDALRHDRPQLGPMLAVGDRLWGLFGRGELDPHRDIVELTPKGSAFATAASESPSDHWWMRHVDTALRSAVEEILPQWTVLNAPTDKKHVLRLDQWQGEDNVVEVHATKGQPFRLARRVELPAGRPTRLRLRVASTAKWTLDVQVSGQDVFREPQDQKSSGGVWKDVDISLAPFAGKTVWLIVRQWDEDGSQPLVKWKSAELIQ